MVPICCFPDDGLSAVNVTVVAVPGYTVPPVEPWRVTEALVPTEPVPVPEPVAVKYAYAMPAIARAPTAPTTTVLRRAIEAFKRILDIGRPPWFRCPQTPLPVSARAS